MKQKTTNVASVKLSTYGASAFSCSGPAISNNLLENLRDTYVFKCIYV